jgi:hypothetical protein
MRTRPISLAFVGAALLVIVGYGVATMLRARAAAFAAEAAAAEAAVGNPFPGKVLLVFLDSRSSIPIEKPQVRKLGEASFLVGMGSADVQGHHWAKNRTVWLPMDRIEMITEFDSVEEMKKAWKEAVETPADGPPVPLPTEKAPLPQKKE